MACNPQNINPDPSCVNQVLSLDCDTGDLSISNGNIVNLACAVSLLETKTQLVALNLVGSFLQLIYLGEDGIQQSKTVDLSPIVQQTLGLNVIDSNSIDLTLGSNVLRADLKVDPSSTLPVSASSAGVKFGCCPETPVTSNTTNTIQLLTLGTNGHLLTANLKYQDSPSVDLSDSSNGLLATVKYSTDPNNAIMAGSDGGLFVEQASAQLATLPNNGYVTTGPTGTLIVGADSKTYRIPDPLPETPITGIDSNTVNLTISGPGNHTVQADVNLTNTNTIQLSTTGSGIQADLKIDTIAPGNVNITSDSNGLLANINCDSLKNIITSQASVQNPVIKVYGTLNNNDCGYADVSISQYGIKIPSFTTTQRISIPSADLYNSLLVFDSTVGAYFYYDAVNSAWVQINGASGGGGGGGLTSITADNGLTATSASNVQLGGTLIQDTIIDNGSHILSITGASPLSSTVDINATGAAKVLNVTCDSTNTAIYGNGVDGTAITGECSGVGHGLEGISQNGSGVLGNSVNGLGGDFRSAPASTTGIIPVIQVGRFSQGTPANGIGGSIDIFTQTTDLGARLSNQISSEWTDAVFATRSSKLILSGLDNGTQNSLLTFLGNGALQLNKYGIGSFTGVAAKSLAADSSGNIVEANTFGTHTITTPTTGGTVNLVNNQINIINPAGTLSTLTVNFPSSPANNDYVKIKFKQAVTTVTYGNGTVIGGVVSPGAEQESTWVYNSSDTSWY